MFYAKESWENHVPEFFDNATDEEWEYLESLVEKLGDAHEIIIREFVPAACVHSRICCDDPDYYPQDPRIVLKAVAEASCWCQEHLTNDEKSEELDLLYTDCVRNFDHESVSLDELKPRAMRSIVRTWGAHRYGYPRLNFVEEAILESAKNELNNA